MTSIHGVAKVAAAIGQLDDMDTFRHVVDGSDPSFQAFATRLVVIARQYHLLACESFGGTIRHARRHHQRSEIRHRHRERDVRWTGRQWGLPQPTRGLLL